MMKKKISYLLLSMGLGFSCPSQSSEIDEINSDLSKTDRVIAELRTPGYSGRPGLLTTRTPRFVKLVKKGVKATNTNNWNCVTDTKTGLTWERKTNWGMRWWNSSYTNTTFNSFPRKPTRARGVCISEGGNPVVTGKSCHTEGYIDYINSLNNSGLCGFKDWRLSSELEMRTILDANKAPPFFVDRRAFPYPEMFNIWTSTPSTGFRANSYAIKLYLLHVISRVDILRSAPMAVLLVRGKM